jgi:hypothetical protein
VLFILFLLIFYLGVCLYRKDMTFVSDLRKVRVSPRSLAGMTREREREREREERDRERKRDN